VDANIILGSSSQIKNLTKAVYRTGLEIDDLVLSVLACCESVLTKRQKELGVVLIDIGASTTSLAVFEEGEMAHVACLSLGSENITNDLAIGLRTSVDVAENVKKEFGDCRPSAADRKDEIDLFNAGAFEHEIVKQRYVNEIIQARVEEILSKVDEELNKIQRAGLLPSGAVFCGGGAKLPGLVESAKNILRLPACLGYALSTPSVSEKVNDLSFQTAVGLVKWGVSMEDGGVSKRGASLVKGLTSVGGQLRKWVNTLMP